MLSSSILFSTFCNRGSQIGIFFGRFWTGFLARIQILTRIGESTPTWFQVILALENQFGFSCKRVSSKFQPNCTHLLFLLYSLPLPPSKHKYHAPQRRMLYPLRNYTQPLILLTNRHKFIHNFPRLLISIIPDMNYSFPSIQLGGALAFAVSRNNVRRVLTRL